MDFKEKEYREKEDKREAENNPDTKEEGKQSKKPEILNVGITPQNPEKIKPGAEADAATG